MKIVMMLASACAPDPRVEKEAYELGSVGHEVTLLAWDRAGSEPETEERDGFRIERIGPPAAYGGGIKTLPLYRRFWRAAADRAVQLAPHAIHCHDTDTASAGLRAVTRLRERGTHLVMDFHELYRLTAMVPQKGMVGAASRFAVDRVERRAVAAASLVIVANPGTADHYRSIGAEGKLVVIDNAPDPDIFSPRDCPDADRPFTVYFIGRKRSSRTLIALMDSVLDRDGVKAVLAGGGVDAERIADLARSNPNVEVMGQVPYVEIPDRYACSDVVYAAFDTAVGNWRYHTPSKAIEAMACGKPVIVSTGTWIGEYVDKHGVGLAVACDDPREIGRALDHLRDNPVEAAEMGRRGRKIVEDGLNWNAVRARLIEAYASLAE